MAAYGIQSFGLPPAPRGPQLRDTNPPRRAVSHCIIKCLPMWEKDLQRQMQPRPRVMRRGTGLVIHCRRLALTQGWQGVGPGLESLHCGIWIGEIQ